MSESKAYPLAHAYLNRVRDADRKVDRLFARLDNLRLLTTDTAVHYSDMPRACSPDQQKLATILAKIDDIDRQIPEAVRVADAIKYEVGNTIDEIQVSDDEAAKVLILRYVNRMPWQQVCSEIGYASAKAFRLRDQGLAALEEYLRNSA